MEYLESTEEARLYVEEVMKTEEVGNELDPEGEQELGDCDLDGQILHPDFQHLNPDDLSIQEEKKGFEKQFKPIEVDDLSILREKTRTLDFYQKKVVEKGIQYARLLVKSLKQKNPHPDPFSLVVMGGAGSGKSTVINVLKQWLHLVLKREGDNPEFPYVIVVAPTGTAAANVRGQTLHSSFGFNFGNKHYSLSDKKRDKTRALFRNLSIVIIDEISMIKSDLLYQLDLRLREIKQKENKMFGGVSLFLFGDIMQLRPCQGSFIFDMPTCEDYRLAYQCKTHWDSFDVMFLEENHRQGDDFEYAELLNRMRVGQQTEKDMDKLQDRVRPEGHPDLKGAMYITCTNKTVMKMNDVRLEELNTELYKISAKHMHPTMLEFKPRIDSRGTVGGTGFLEMLNIKVGARVMLIHNLDVLDGLANGTRGTLKAVEKDSNGNVIRLMISFDEPYQGFNKRRENAYLSKKYPGCTPIEKYLCSYSIAKKTSVASSTAQVFQFPVVVCFAATTHKFQGGTIIKPNKLAADLRTVFEDAMAYVMLSRVQDIDQLYIVGSLPEHKLSVSRKCLEELQNLFQRSVNKLPAKWEQNEGNIKISALNVHSILDKVADIRYDEILRFSDVICFSETWLKDDSFVSELEIEGYKQHINSYGNERGKGLAVLYKSNRFTVSGVVKSRNLQVTHLTSDKIDVIAIYRSADSHDTFEHIAKMIAPDKTIIICGDFNICYLEKKSHRLIQSLLNLGFKQMVKKATHINGGLIDHIYHRNGRVQFDVEASLYSPYYTAFDHDAVCCTLTMKTVEES